MMIKTNCGLYLQKWGDVMSQITEYDENKSADDRGQKKTYTMREVIIRRIWFYIGLLVWILILSIPFFFVILGMRGEMSFNLWGDVPDNRLRIWMVMEPDERGIGYSLPSVVEREADALTVETHVRYALWQGEGENVAYCQHYVRDDGDSYWEMVETYEGDCEAIE